MSSSTATETISQPRFQLPGLNLPLNWTPHAKYLKIDEPDYDCKTFLRERKTPRKIEVPAQGDGKDLFRTALSDADVQDGKTSLALTTLRELTMLEIMNALTDKPGWEDKVFDETIAQKWKAEALATEGRDVTQNMVNWIIAELRYKAKIFKETGGAVTIFNGDVVKSDLAIPKDLQESLRAAVRKLEDIPEVYKDYHPGSGGKVLDLVHPSLFPLIYGRSRILEGTLVGLEDCLEAIGKGNVLPVRAVEETVLDKKGSELETCMNEWEASPPPYSRNFQWLPCDVDISGDGESVNITSYINNLHPQKHRNLYKVVEDIIAKAIPLWNMTLTPLKTAYPRPIFPRWPDSETSIAYMGFERILVKSIEYDPDQDLESHPDRPEQEDEDDDWFEERVYQWELRAKRVVQPDAGEFHPPTVPDAFRDEFFEPGTDILRPEKSVDLKRDYGNRGLQVIVKLANIELTPDKREYEGGTWHVEGQLNEHICATALYYFASENITTSRLAFRQQSSRDYANGAGYEQNHFSWLEQLYGCENEESAIQEVGSALCREGRLITFPNILQHRVEPFKLLDPTKNGYRKILALFLVDPGIRIISTTNVPPQQKDWWSDELEGKMMSGKALGKLSPELRKIVFDDVNDFPIGLEEAKEARLALMEERKAYGATHTSTAFEGNTFNLCEH